MKSLVKSALVVGQVFGLVIGDKFTTPLAQALEEDPSLRFGG